MHTMLCNCRKSTIWWEAKCVLMKLQVRARSLYTDISAWNNASGLAGKSGAMTLEQGFQK